MFALLSIDIVLREKLDVRANISAVNFSVTSVSDCSEPDCLLPCQIAAEMRYIKYKSCVI